MIHSGTQGCFFLLQGIQVGRWPGTLVSFPAPGFWRSPKQEAPGDPLLWGPALEQLSLAGCLPKNLGPTAGAAKPCRIPCRDASPKNSLGRCARKLAFAGCSLHAEASTALRFPNECNPLAELLNQETNFPKRITD